MIYRTVEDLKQYISFPEADGRALAALLEAYPMRIPQYYLDLIDFSDESDPIRLMSIPSPQEFDREGSLDTSGEQENTVIPGLQHKYDETVMILSTNKCAMYCRHCFRKRLVGLPSEEVASHLPEIAEYIRAHREVSNVLISGGDALMNSTDMLRRYLELLAPIEHIDFIRFGTRIPVVLPSRITDDPGLLALIEEFMPQKQLVFVTQFNHPRELTSEAARAVEELRRRGAVLRNQTVLLRGVNDKAAVLGELMRGLTAHGIMPYYVFQCRPVSGVKNRFQVPLHEGYAIVEEAKAMQNGFGKSFRYCMSHVSGKLELLGEAGGGAMYFKYHEAKYRCDYGRVFSLPVEDGQCWLPDSFRL